MQYRKITLGQTDIEYLGFLVTRTGIQTMNKKVEDMVKMTPPKNTKEVRAFIRIVTCCRDMWTRRSHLLHTLTALTSPKVKFKWTDMEQEKFDGIKRNVTHNTLLSYSDFNKRFDIHTDSRDYQLGAVIIKNGKPIAFYSRKLTGTQK